MYYIFACKKCHRISSPIDPTVPKCIYCSSEMDAAYIDADAPSGGFLRYEYVYRMIADKNGNPARGFTVNPERALKYNKAVGQVGTNLMHTLISIHERNNKPWTPNAEKVLVGISVGEKRVSSGRYDEPCEEVTINAELELVPKETFKVSVADFQPFKVMEKATFKQRLQVLFTGKTKEKK